LDDDHVPIEFAHQSGKGQASTVVQVLPLVLQKHLTNGEENWIPQIGAEKIPL
jgi:hypothetical protein